MVGKCLGVVNVPSELINYGGEASIAILTALANNIWEENKWHREWTHSLVIRLPKKSNLKLCENYRTISLISHPSKVMLRIILNRLKIKGRWLPGAGRSTVEQIFNYNKTIENHLQHQRDIFQNFINFRNASDHVWHDGLWHVMRWFNIDKGLLQIIRELYGNASSAVLPNGLYRHFFRTSVDVRQGYLLFPVLFNIFLKMIMQETLHDHHNSIVTNGRPNSKIRGWHWPHGWPK